MFKTRFMLDELGNLQSEGHGISNLSTMLSIGLGQDQQFTLILQTLQQLRDVYGDSVDKIIQGNTSNIVFLKSTDDSMLDTLQKMSGTTHRSFVDSKTITRDMEKLWMKNEGKTSYTMTTKEMPVISYNDMAFIPERNSIVFRAGNSPIWNRNETILPMSWRLFKDTIVCPGKDFTLQTIPTLSSAVDFDVRKNQPDFEKMLDKRLMQAARAGDAKMTYQGVYGYSEHEIEQLDPDVYSDEIMEIINTAIYEQARAEAGLSDEDEDADVQRQLFEQYRKDQERSIRRNTEQERINRQFMAEMDSWSANKFAGGMISPNDLVSKTGGGSIPHALDNVIIEVYKEIKGDLWRDTDHFRPEEQKGGLCGVNGEVFIQATDAKEDIQRLDEASRRPDSRVYSETPIEYHTMYRVTDAFYRFLANLPSWDFANGRFEKAMERKMKQ